MRLFRRGEVFSEGKDPDRRRAFSVSTVPVSVAGAARFLPGMAFGTSVLHQIGKSYAQRLCNFEKMSG